MFPVTVESINRLARRLQLPFEVVANSPCDKNVIGEVLEAMMDRIEALERERKVGVSWRTVQWAGMTVRVHPEHHPERWDEMEQRWEPIVLTEGDHIDTLKQDAP